MKPFLCFAAALLSLSISFAQTGEISGVVLDAKTGEPLPFANVFINNTTLGSPTDTKGQFVLRNVPVGDADVVFSFVGYKTYHHRVSVKEHENQNITIRLLPEEIELAGVEVKGTRDKEWEKQLSKFENIFLGNTKTSTSCKITNSWVLDFSEADEGKTFVAKASQPLEIDNLSLGYKVIFYLKDFKAGAQSYSILGYIQFQEIPTEDPKMALRWTQNRKEVFLRSDRNLFKSILDGKAKDQGFLLYTDKSGYETAKVRSAVFYQELNKSIVPYSPDDLVTPGDREGEMKIKMKGRIEVHYLNEYVVKRIYKDIPYPVSWIEVNGGYVYVNKLGVVLNSPDVFVSGAMSSQRVADMLPLDYQPDKTVSIEPVKVIVSQRKYQRLQEKIYLHTDKPYYYTGEILWFKGYMNYRLPDMRDSLSKVAYVELIGPDRKILQRKTLLIDSGFVQGDFFLRDSLPPGNYFLRAYTNWMRNYVTDQVFTRSIPVLSLTDKVEPQERKELSLSDGLVLKTDKPRYLPREKIQLEVELKDKEGKPLMSHLSVSVTDDDQVVPVEYSSIVSDFALPEKMETPALVELKYPPEYGVSFFGKFENDKGEPEKANITVVQGKFEDLIYLETEADGRFWLTGFQFYDTMRFAFQARNEKGKPYGNISIEPPQEINTDFICRELALKFQHTETPQRIISNYEVPKDARLLENVTVTGQKITESTLRGVQYGKPDYVLTGEKLLAAAVGQNLAAGLQGKIPGLQVTWYWDQLTNTQHYIIRIRGGTSTFGMGTTKEPLIIVDGIPYAQQPDGGNTAGDFLASLNPSFVDRIEVITHASPIFGVRGTNGVIIIYTKAGDYRMKGPNQSLKAFHYITLKGYSRARSFEFPDYSNPKVREAVQADFRATLFWDPEVQTDKTGKTSLEFYASDRETRYRVVVEGVTETGLPVRGVYVFNLD